MGTTRDAILARLVECLGEAYPIEQIVTYLDTALPHFVADSDSRSSTILIQQVIESLLASTPPDKSEQSPAVLLCPAIKRKPEYESKTDELPLLKKNAFDVLAWTDAAETAGRGSVKHVMLTAENVESHIPCELFLDWMDRDSSTELLQFLQQDACENELWYAHRYFISDREVHSSHKSTLYSSIPETSFSYSFQASELKASPYASSPVLEKIATRVSEFVTERLKSNRVRLHTSVSKSPLDLQSNINKAWIGNICVGNEYLNGTQITGFHSDNLEYIGPRPVIASLSLGATRTFRVRRIKEAADAILPVWELLESERNESKAEQEEKQIAKNSTSNIIYNIKLPHGSLLVMYPPMQELYKHEVGLERRFAGHPISGLVRYNLTFRMYRNEFSSPPLCRCGVRSNMKPVFKIACGASGNIVVGGVKENMLKKSSLNAERIEKYYYSCVKGRGEKSGCGFFEWVV
ncbi:hypothetical protein HK100_005427 [Physocladia obscura]|uniref:Alpha-ketoglutarate-dependent dioxygenase AlkB-like domain-containing protein n=1 Tax=Physocladia obscura TaxID=109957 RepID=A0AAD5TBQ0_9FUNG|nr:hypothetical protein HK100_005427 [Physocladia obscura]